MNRPPERHASRGSTSNPESRFSAATSDLEDDGWGSAAESQAERPTLKTELYLDRTQRLITTNASPDIPFDQSINPYKGCEHGCVYCYARPTHAFLDLSPGLDFETKIFRKSDPGSHLKIELSREGYVPKTIAMGTNTDPYQPLEKNQRVTREILEVMVEHRHPVSIVTKSKLILRDLDLLSALAEQGLVHVHVSVTTLDNQLKGQLEPRTAGPAARLRTIAELRRAGVPTGAMVAPVIPFVNDHEIEDIVSQVAAAGAQSANYVLLRLPNEVAPLFEEWLMLYYPDRAKRVMSAIQSTRGGRKYRAQWHTRMVGTGQMAELVRTRFHAALKRNGLKERDLGTLRTDLFEPPPKALQNRTDRNQLSLF